MSAKVPHITIPISTKSKEGGFDHEVDVSMKLSLRALIMIGVILHVVSIPIGSLMSYLTATASAASNLLP